MGPRGGRPPRVSVGIPVRNGGELLAHALRSVQNQTEEDLEIIISDNGSEDGSRDFLEAAAVADPRICCFRQNPAIRAYDNFHFVLRRAQGDYFMWAAHDDTRDADFVARMVSALDGTPEAVLAFGDLNIVTPENPVGRIRRFPFQTQGMGPWARLRKLSRMQCYYIYGVWRTSAIRRVPYAYCAWWPDLPMMLAAAVLGTFVHVPGTRLHYLEVLKSNLDRVKHQDLTSRFSLPLGVAGLIGATYRACAGVGGPLIGAYSAALVMLKQAINLPGFLSRRLRRPPDTLPVPP